MRDLVADGNSVILVDHDTQILQESDWIIEMGPEAGAKGGQVIAQGTVSAIHTVKPLSIDIPKGRLTVVTGVSGSGKTTMVLKSFVPALDKAINGKTLPKHIRTIRADGIQHVKLIDATPIGIN